jgi:hypothetical protein
MGADIHMTIQTRESSNDPWRTRTDIEAYGDRNYRVFAALAGVRNGEGFAGVKTGNALVPISEPRGFPEDYAAQIANVDDDLGYEEYSCLRDEVHGEALSSDHSETWLTLDEVRAYDWDQVSHRVGTVNAEQYKVFKEKGRPESWSAGCFGRGVIHVSNEEMDRRIAEDDWTLSRSTALVSHLREWADDIEHKASMWDDQALFGGPLGGLLLDTNIQRLRELLGAGPLPEQVSYYTQVAWDLPLRDDCRGFLEWLTRLEKATLGYSPKNVRLVFGFDS